MKKIWFYIVFIFMLFPTIVLAAGIELEFIEPSYDVGQTTYVQDPEKPLVFNFTFTPESRDMKYRIKLTNTEQKDLYITEIDHTTDSNVVISYDGIKQADIFKPGESKYVNIRFEMKTFPTTTYSNEITFYFKYDLAENHIPSQEDPTDPNKRKSNKLNDNPATGLVNYIMIIIPFIIVLSVVYLLINKKNKIFKTFIILLVPITTGLLLSSVKAEKTDGAVVVIGNVSFEEVSSGSSDPDNPDNPDDPDNPDNPDNPDEPILPKGIYTVEIDPNGGLFRGSPNVYKANYRKKAIVDVSDIDRLYYKFIKWTYGDGDDSFFNGDKITVEGNIKLKANWEYGPYFNVTIDPNGGLYNLENKVYKTKIKEGEVIEVHDSNRPGDSVVFNGWEEVSNTNSYKDGKITMGKRDVYLKAKWEGIYNLTFDLNADDATCDVLSKEVTNTYPIGPLPTPQRDGYIFDGWTINNKPIDATTIFKEDKDSVAVAHWLARDDVVYTVKHYKQKPLHNADVKTLDNYDLIKTETFKGVTDSEITPAVETIAGYDKPEVIKTTILGNGKRVVEYYYYVRRYDINVVLPEKGIKEVMYKTNGSTEFKSLGHSDTLKVEFNSRYDLYAVADDGYLHYSTGPSKTFNGTMGEATITFAPTVEKCPKGHSCSSGSNEPEECPAGTYAEEGSGQCKSCPAGSHASSAGSDHCDTCLAGTACEEGSKNPVTCPPGTIAATAGSSKCTACAEGTYSTTAGSTSCTDCPVGHKCSSPNPQPTPTPSVPIIGPIKPEICKAGSYAGAKASECTSCPEGYYSKNDGSDSCVVCPPGHKCEAGSDEPKECPAGTYAEQGSGQCKSCPGGTYQNESGKDSCKVCPVGSECPTGSVNPKQCTPGHFGDAQGLVSCKTCAENTYSNTNGAQTCIRCDVGKESGAGASECTPKKFPVTFTGANGMGVYGTVASNPLQVPYDLSNSTRLTPRAGYYISGISCTNGYRVNYTDTYLNNGSTVTYSTVTVYNPGVETGSTCTYSLTRITAEMLNYNSSYTTCRNAQCAIDDLYNRIGALGL